MPRHSTLAEQLARVSMLERAVTQCGVTLWVTDPSGEILLSEGGLLETVGLEPGQVVGLNIRDFASYEQWAEAVDRIEAGEEKVSFIWEPTSEQAARARRDGHPAPHEAGGVWLQTYSPLRSPSGRVTGILTIALPLSGAKVAQSLGYCPSLGDCESGGKMRP